VNQILKYVVFFVFVILVVGLVSGAAILYFKPGQAVVPTPLSSSAKVANRTPARQTGEAFLKQNGQWVKARIDPAGLGRKLAHFNSWTVDGVVNKVDITNKTITVKFNQASGCQTVFYDLSGEVCDQGVFFVNTVTIYDTYRDFTTPAGQASSSHAGILADLDNGDWVTIYASESAFTHGPGYADVAASR